MSRARSPLSILFICSGNTCRSPLAVLALRAELGEEASAFQIGSAGTSAARGEPASPGSVRVASASGLDLSLHRSRPVTREMVLEADLVFVMTPSHRAAVEALGAPRERVHVLSEWPAPGDPGAPVFDPFGASIEAYEECWRRIQHHVRRIAPHVRQLLRERRIP